MFKIKYFNDTMRNKELYNYKFFVIYTPDNLIVHF